MTGAGSGGLVPPDGMDAEEAERCPICLGVLSGGELAMPDSCSHVFCLRCLLTWAELQMAPSCPVDRKPFTSVYRWDRNLSCEQVPVRKRVTQPEAENCCCRKPEQKVSLKSKPVRTSRRIETERTFDSKTKGLVRKCNDEDPLSLSRKKVRGAECCTWSPCVSVSTTSTQDISEPMWVAEDILYDSGFKQCKPQEQDCPWLSPVSPILANGTASFHPPGWNPSQLPFGLSSSCFTSSSLFGPGHFVFQGVVCAITCPKGGEKRGGRASTSKAPTKEAEALPARRSGRHNKTQEESPPSDPSLPHTTSSDSDSSSGQSAKPDRASQAPAKRKGKQVTNRKASGKRKVIKRKKSSPEVVSSPAASEDEDEGDENENMAKEEEEEETTQELDFSNSERPQSDTEGSVEEIQDVLPSDDQTKGAESLSKDMGHNTDETQEQSNELEQNPEHEQLELSGAESESNQGREDDEPASPHSTGEKDSEKRTSPSASPSGSQSDLVVKTPDCEEQDDNMEICMELDEINDKESSEEVKADSYENSPQPASLTIGHLAVTESKASESAHTESEEPSIVDSSWKRTKDESPSRDDTDVVAMDCSSPISDRAPVMEELNESAALDETETPASASQVPKDEGHKEQQERERSPERKNGRQRRSRFHSPTSTWSPKRDSKREPARRSRSRERDGSPPSSRSSRARSRDKDRDGERDYFRREHSRERRRRRSRSRSKSRSRSRSRTRSYRRAPSPERPSSREQSPQRRERRGGWRSGQGSGSGSEGRRNHGGAGRFENGVPTESSPDRQGWSENPDWVTEKSRDVDGRSRDFGGGSRWEDQRNSGENRGEPRGRGGRGGFDRNRGSGRGGSNRSFYNQQEEGADNRWQSRNIYSGTGNNSGTDSYSRFNENRGGGRRKDSEPGDSMLDRSGWSSASSWAVRRTLPADVQDYYSKRERGGPGGWNRQEEEQPTAAADPPKSEPPPQTVPGNAPVPVVNVIPPQLNVLHHHYPMQGPRGALPVSLQPAAPYAMPPQVPVHLHPSVPLLQVPAVGAQGLPPPPPPPPPMQQGSQTAAAQPDGYTTQMPSTMVGFAKPTLLPTPTKAGIATVTPGQLAPSQVLPSSTTQPSHHNMAQADSSKKEKKQQIQEKAINEVKTAIKPFYQRKEITKEEYKEIVRKAVEKVCHSKSGEVNSSKVANLVKAYVDKYKHARKK